MSMVGESHLNSPWKFAPKKRRRGGQEKRGRSDGAPDFGSAYEADGESQ